MKRRGKQMKADDMAKTGPLKGSGAGWWRSKRNGEDWGAVIQEARRQ